jgi:nicotinamidase-related amidase
MSDTRLLSLHCRSQRLAQNGQGYTVWKQKHVICKVPAQHTAIIICDMWDQHWSRGANERVDAMAPRMNKVLDTARAAGVHIIHAPSNVVDNYKDTPARRRILNVPAVPPPQLLEHPDPPLPIDNSDEGSDTGETEAKRVWSKQHAAITIDQSRDVISDSGEEIYSYMQQQDIIQLAIMGVHTNMCVLNRSFGIKQMVRWGIDVVLVRDLTDTMYNPAMPPYVSHHEGTHLVIAFIEKHWCPTITSGDFTKQP